LDSRLGYGYIGDLLSDAGAGSENQVHAWETAGTCTGCIHAPRALDGFAHCVQPIHNSTHNSSQQFREIATPGWNFLRVIEMAIRCVRAAPLSSESCPLSSQVTQPTNSSRSAAICGLFSNPTKTLSPIASRHNFHGSSNISDALWKLFPYQPCRR